jgi:cellulose synthase/poly-beta-1,6-N-acetylglucosamine synthase-like glycosyltransferase
VTNNVLRVGTALAVLGAVHAAVNARRLPSVRPAARSPEPVSVLVPARNEATRIPGLLASLQSQDVADIVVLDDGSTDGTADIVRTSEDSRIRLVEGRPVPPGWVGKPHACVQLASAADPAVRVLVFLDADVRLAPGAVAGAVACLRRRRVDLLSVWPRQEARSPAERLVQPLQLWSVLSFLPLALAERSSRPSLAAANGQFLVVRRDAYEASGGHAATPAAVLDDIELARTLKRSGFRTAVVSGKDVASCRMYENWSEVRDGYAKSLWSAFGSPVAGVAVAGALVGGWVLPAVAAVRGSRVAGVLGVVAGVTGRVVTARAGGDRVWPDAAGQPASAAVLAYLIVRSVVLSRRGGLTWRGRPVRG